MTAVPGLLAQHSFSCTGDRTVDGFTVSLWSDQASMSAWAYGPGTHRLLIEQHRAEAMSDRLSFTRCRIVRSEGSWYGWSPVGGRHDS